jgi:hypothetical protein
MRPAQIATSSLSSSLPSVEAFHNHVVLRRPGFTATPDWFQQFAFGVERQVFGTLAPRVIKACLVLRRSFPVFDVGETIGTAGMILLVVIATVRHTIELYRAEPL